MHLSLNSPSLHSDIIHFQICVVSNHHRLSISPIAFLNGFDCYHIRLTSHEICNKLPWFSHVSIEYPIENLEISTSALIAPQTSGVFHCIVLGLMVINIAVISSSGHFWLVRTTTLSYHNIKKSYYKSPSPIWWFPKIGVPQIIHFSKIFQYKPSIWGYPDYGNLHIIQLFHHSMVDMGKYTQIFNGFTMPYSPLLSHLRVSHHNPVLLPFLSVAFRNRRRVAVANVRPRGGFWWPGTRS